MIRSTKDNHSGSVYTWTISGTIKDFSVLVVKKLHVYVDIFVLVKTTVASMLGH